MNGNGTALFSLDVTGRIALRNIELFISLMGDGLINCVSNIDFDSFVLLLDG